MESIYGPDYAKMMGLTGATGTEKASGFVVVIEGYSPYKDIRALLDPPNVRDDPGRWGLVTRLEFLKEFLRMDVNAPFEIYLKNSNHFKLETGPVDVDAETLPQGVGTWKFTPSQAALEDAAANPMNEMAIESMEGTWTLIDPVTKETMSAEPVLDQFGKPKLNALLQPVMENRDSWFKLQFKLKWAGAPPTPEGVGGDKKDRR